MLYFVTEKGGIMSDQEAPQKPSQPKVSYKEYLAQKAKESKKKNFELPLPVKIILLTPFLLLCCFGLFYLPWIIFTIATSPAK